jgi:uncharacterized protein YecT (DUF1311 family)
MLDGMNPPLRTLVPVAFLLPLLLPPAWGDEPAGAADPDCARVAKLDFPASDRPSEPESKELKGCLSRKYYYGMGTAVDYARARKCAFVELSAGDSEVFGGSRMLMTLYANGHGVKRDLDLALKLACADEPTARAEKDGRIRHLKAMMADSASEARFDYCDDITGGFMMGACAGREEEIAAAKRATEMAAITRGWPAPHQEAFKRLQAAFEAFTEERAGSEVDLSGTARAMFVIEERSKLKDGFKAALARFEKGALPEGGTAELKAADAELNRVYAAILKKGDLGYGTVEKSGIRSTQRKWLKYRAAWVKFGAIRYPKVAADAWKAWLTKERTAQLKPFLGG